MGTRWIDFRNDSGEELPAFGVLLCADIVTVNQRKFISAEKPDSNAPEGVYYLNGAVAVPNGSYGKCTASGDGPCWALYDDSDGTPANGETWGPEDASWELHKDVSGFDIFGDPTSGRVLVARQGGGGTCADRNEIHQLTILGSPTGGTFTMTLTLNAVSETLTFNFDDDSTEVTTELETHSEAASGDFTVTGGPFPNATMQIEYVQNFAAIAIDPPVFTWGDLTGGTGVAVFYSRPQNGHPG